MGQKKDFLKIMKSKTWAFHDVREKLGKIWYQTRACNRYAHFSQKSMQKTVDSAGKAVEGSY